MKTPPIKRKGRAQTDAAPGKRLQQVRKTIARIQPAQVTVEKFQEALAELKHRPLPTGPTATELLDTCKFAQAFCEEVFAKARELLKREPEAIPNWYVSETPTRRLSGDTVKVFETLADELTPEEFMGACSTSLTALSKAFAERNPQWSVDEIEHVLNRVLSDLISWETVTRLSRSKEKQIEIAL